jgi:hypothetical protein
MLLGHIGGTIAIITAIGIVDTGGDCGRVAAHLRDSRQTNSHWAIEDRSPRQRPVSSVQVEAVASMMMDMRNLCWPSGLLDANRASAFERH